MKKMVLAMEDGDYVGVQEKENLKGGMFTERKEEKKLALELLETRKNMELPKIQAGEYCQKESLYVDKDGNSIVLPKGWTVSGISDENTIWGENVAVVIYQIPEEIVPKIDWGDKKQVKELQKIYNQFVGIPVGLLQADATLDGKNFNSKYGRFPFNNEQLSNIRQKWSYYEKISPERERKINEQKVCWISRYPLSGTVEKPKSIRALQYTTELNWFQAKKMALNVTQNSGLIYGADWDTMLRWFIEIYGNINNVKNITQKGMINQIYVEYLWYWTIEGCNDDLGVCRGGIPCYSNYPYYRGGGCLNFSGSDISARATLL